MPEDLKQATSSQQLSYEQMQSLIATSTGTLDVYVVPVHGGAAMLLPQNNVLSAMNAQANVKHIEWHDKALPTFQVSHPDLQDVTALVIAGDSEENNFAILCDDMPTAMRLRISGVIDIDKPYDPLVYQYVRVEDKEYQVPNLVNIQKQLFK